MSWRKVKIADLGRVVTGKTPPTAEAKYFNGEIQFISPIDLDWDKYFVHGITNTMITPEALAKFKNQVVPPNTIFFTCIGYTFGKIGIATQECLTNQQINSVVVNKNNDYKFVYYLLTHSKNYIKTFNSGLNTPIVKKSSFEQVELDAPLLPTQQKIASILSTYDDLIENNLKRIKLLEEAAQNIYKEWFVHFRFPNHEKIKFENGLPKGWKHGCVGDLSSVKSGFAFKSNDWQEEGNPVIKITNIQNNTVNLFSCDCVSNEVAKNAERFELFEGNLIIAMTGATVGKIGLLPKLDRRYYINQRVGLFRPKEANEDYTPFLFAFFSSEEALKKILNLAQGAAQPNISASQIESVALIIPTKNILIEFTDRITPFLCQIQTLYFANQKLKEARDILLPRLMNRTIEV